MNKGNNFSYYIIYKPYNILSQFTAEAGKKSLKDLYAFPKDVYPVGRLDADSEGLLLLTNDSELNNQLLNPVFKHKRSYFVQMEGEITTLALQQLITGVIIKINDKLYHTKSAQAEIITEPVSLPERTPPIRFRKNSLTSWIKLTLIEGKNRQVRKMTASIGYPTLRLVRYSIEDLQLQNMEPGQVIQLSKNVIYRKLNLINNI